SQWGMIVDFKSTPLEPLALKARVVQLVTLGTACAGKSVATIGRYRLALSLGLCGTRSARPSTKTLRQEETTVGSWRNARAWAWGTRFRPSKSGPQGDTVCSALSASSGPNSVCVQAISPTGNGDSRRVPGLIAPSRPGSIVLRNPQ